MLTWSLPLHLFIDGGDLKMFPDGTNSFSGFHVRKVMGILTFLAEI